MKKENKSLLAHVVAGICVGLTSFFVVDRRIAFVIMIAVLVFLKMSLGKLLGEEKFKWWFTNGMWIYVFIWIISWTILYNL